MTSYGQYSVFSLGTDLNKVRIDEFLSGAFEFTLVTAEYYSKCRYPQGSYFVAKYVTIFVFRLLNPLFVTDKFAFSPCYDSCRHFGHHQVLFLNKSVTEFEEYGEMN